MVRRGSSEDDPGAPFPDLAYTAVGPGGDRVIVVRRNDTVASGESIIIAEEPFIPAGADPNVLVADDFDGDGDPDFIVGEGNEAGFGAFDSVIIFRKTCSADVDSDGAIGFSDLLAILGAWGPCAGCAEDLDADGDVGLSDLRILLSVWGTDC